MIDRFFKYDYIRYRKLYKRLLILEFILEEIIKEKIDRDEGKNRKKSSFKIKIFK